jgi:hypothetical protein
MLLWLRRISMMISGFASQHHEQPELPVTQLT